MLFDPSSQKACGKQTMMQFTSGILDLRLRMT